MAEKGKSRVGTVLVVVLFLAAIAGGVYFYRNLLRGTVVGNWLGLKETVQAKDIYYCPMHPDYKASKPGDCPICNMALVKMEPAQRDVAASKDRTAKKQSASQDIYYCPMHPDYRSNKPGTCPICNMDLVKLEPEKKESPIEHAHAPGEASSHGQPKVLYWYDAMNPSHHYDKPGKAPDGMDLVPFYEEPAPETGKAAPGGVMISPEKQQLIGVQVSTVTEEPLTRTIVTVGQITYDETRLARIQARVEGWIEQVFVDFTGKWVKKGQPLLSVYSPELLSTQRELLIAKRAKDSLGTSAFPEIAANAQSLYEATRDRLRLWDISDGQIRELEKRGTPTRTMTLFAPVEGFVLTRNALRGQRITPEMELYTIADLSTIWVLADIYEYEVPLIHLGQPATMTFPYFPGKTFTGKVTFIYPQLDNQTRTLKVRLQFPNVDHQLKPDMYASVSFPIDYGRKLAVPESAVLDSGTRQIVFIAREDGHFEPRTVQLGAKVNDRFIIESGLTVGEKIVTSGNFLIDSESQLKAAMSGMTGHEH